MRKSMAATRMKHKDFFGLLDKSESINWAQQTQLLKKLMGKYRDSEIVYAINYWKKKGLPIKSFGFLTYKNFKNMKEPVSLYHAELNINYRSGDSSERNKLRIEHNSKTECREEYYYDLFETSREDN